MNKEHNYDVIIAGAGPAGTIAAIQLIRRGHNVAIVEKKQFPRFQIGESFLPYNFELLTKMGIIDRILKLPHVTKYGGEFSFGGTLESTRFTFNKKGVKHVQPQTFNIRRELFDNELLEIAREEGAAIFMPAGVKEIQTLEEGNVTILTDQNHTLHAKYLLDATGQATLVSRHLGTKTQATEPYLNKIAYFEHFEGVKRLPGMEEGHPAIAMCKEGWFWIIALDEKLTSIGMVIDSTYAKSIDVPANEMLRWGMQRCPFVADRTQNITGPEKNRVCGDFSYRCDPYSGPGYFLLGDAASFFDPVFSSGVCICMESGRQAAIHVSDILKQNSSPEDARTKYNKFFKHTSDTFFHIIELFYDHHFREMFLQGKGPFHIENGVLAILAGHIYPKPRLVARMQYWLFNFFIKMHRKRPIVPEHESYSLVTQEKFNPRTA